MREAVVISVAKKLLVGVYENGTLVESIEKEGKTSELLPLIFKEILKKPLQRVYYARGPGSFMGIKLSYIFLKTLEITKDIELLGCDTFVFNGNRPIKAVGKLYFVKENGKIVTKKMEAGEGDFTLPASTKNLPCSKETEPLYILPAL